MSHSHPDAQSDASPLRVEAIDLSSADQATAWLDLLDVYASDRMGGGAPLAASVRANLVPRLRELSTFHGAVAWWGEERKPVGLINCFAGFSTFAARPLLNIHDLVVRTEARRRGVGRALLDWAEARAHQLGCCKLTLEVLSNNVSALRVYDHAGFAPYVLDPTAGQALFLEKKLTG